MIFALMLAAFCAADLVLVGGRDQDVAVELEELRRSTIFVGAGEARERRGSSRSAPATRRHVDAALAL